MEREALPLSWATGGRVLAGRGRPSKRAHRSVERRCSGPGAPNGSGADIPTEVQQGVNAVRRVRWEEDPRCPDLRWPGTPFVAVPPAARTAETHTSSLSGKWGQFKASSGTTISVFWAAAQQAPTTARIPRIGAKRIPSLRTIARCVEKKPYRSEAGGPIRGCLDSSCCRSYPRTWAAPLSRRGGIRSEIGQVPITRI